MECTSKFVILIDKSLQAMSKRSLEIIEEGVKVWPNVNLKLLYAERLMATNMSKLISGQVDFPSTINSVLGVSLKVAEPDHSMSPLQSQETSLDSL